MKAICIYKSGKTETIQLFDHADGIYPSVLAVSAPTRMSASVNDEAPITRHQIDFYWSGVTWGGARVYVEMEQPNVVIFHGRDAKGKDR